MTQNTYTVRKCNINIFIFYQSENKFESWKNRQEREPSFKIKYYNFI